MTKATSVSKVSAKQQQVVDLVAELLVVNGVRWVRGLELRRRMSGSSRETKRAQLLELVPEYLSLHGSPEEDSYSLTPLGALQSRYHSTFKALATQLRQLVVQAYEADPEFGSVTWDQITRHVRRDGGQLTDTDAQLLLFVSFCLGAWGGSGRTVSRPLPARLEDILEIDDIDELFLRAHRHLEQMRTDSPEEAVMASETPDPTAVFVIHGRNLEARDEMTRFLRACGLKPINFSDLRAEMGGTPTIDQIVELGMRIAQGVVALITADEYAALRPELRRAGDGQPSTARWQPRPNVIFEAGMAFAKDRDRLVFVLLGEPELFTDVAGVHVLRPTNDPKGDRATLRDTLRKGMGCSVEDSTEWMRHGDFEECVNIESPRPRDPFHERGVSHAAASTHSDEDAHILLTGWLSELPISKSASALHYSTVATESGTSYEQARRLLPTVVQEHACWTITHAGETVFRMKYTRPNVNLGVRKPPGGGY